MAREPIRVYADTSVFGGAFDQQFMRASRTFFAQVDERRFRLVSSTLVADELRDAPERVRVFSAGLLSRAEETAVSVECLALRDAYLAEGIVPPGSATDALHVAVATVARCDLIVSWNFSHIVHFEKIPRYNAVNALRGYGPIRVHSPEEVIRHEEEAI